MPKPLVIVESPAKARTISRFLGGDFVVESSIGHVRDLPRNAAEVPASHKGEAWARLGVDIEHDFKPLYVVNSEKRSQVAKRKRLATGRDFDESGRMAADAEAVVLDEGGASGLAERLRDSDFAVRSVEEKPYKRSPYAPFMT